MEKRPDHIIPQKSDNDTLYSDVKTAAQSGDNDSDRIAIVPDESKKATDEAYLQQSQGGKSDD